MTFLALVTLSTKSPRDLGQEQADEFLIEAEMAEPPRRNRTLLSALPEVQKRTTLRAAWTLGDTTECYFHPRGQRRF